MGDGPLAGKVILLTRPEERGRSLAELLRERGAIPVEAPTIRIQPSPGPALERAVAAAAEGEYEWVVFTSPATVEAWMERAARLGLDPGAVRARVAAVGAATEAELRAHGIAADLVPASYTTEALGRSFPRGSGAVLLPRADVAPPELEEAIAGKGWTPVRVEAYRTRRVTALPAEAREALRDGRVDAVTFTSASTVDGFVRAEGVVRGPRVVCIGPVTARAARDAGFSVHAVARPHTVEGLLEACARALR
jgi:uroporphyrinogen III methyltransferase/synthase